MATTKVVFSKSSSKPSCSVNKTIEAGLQISAPSWPLQNTVAVNPFWFLRHQTFSEALNSLSGTLKTPLYMPFSYYQNALETGSITWPALEEAIKAHAVRWPDLPRTQELFMAAANAISSSQSNRTTLAELFSNRVDLNHQVITDLGKYAAAYLDERQAIAAFPWAADSFFHGWLQAQKIDQSMKYLGLQKFNTSLTGLSGLGAEEAITLMLAEFGILSADAQLAYIQSLTASILGWSSQFKYVEWQKSLGYPVQSKANAVDLLAVRMSYDYGIYASQNDRQKDTMSAWHKNLLDRPFSEAKAAETTRYQQVLQFALELSYQKQIAPQLSKVSDQVLPKAQLLFCIDVRSEMLRRNIEETIEAVQTIGFAGFFGVPFDYCSIDESKPSHRLPVLLTPAFKVSETHLETLESKAQQGTAWLQVSSYFRNLRKNPLSSFLYVELFGALYMEKALRRSFLSIANKLKGRQVPSRFAAKGHGPSQSGVLNGDGTNFDLDQKIGRAEAVLRHIGLTESFARLVVILGHGSVTTNNAFGSSLDCGACGGHAGDINARFLADLLNDSVVRTGLAAKGVCVPAETQFIAGVHETVTDDIFILEPAKIPAHLQDELRALKKKLDHASQKTSEERYQSKPNNMDSKVATRSKNWSEVRPEWGLAGNACFIVAPRSRTKGMNLSSRSFLHDYDWRKDQEQEYKTLELIMTAPMVVTNWINLQYYASTVAPSTYGSGNKILHNLVNETGVYEGNGGDLRVGLPLQSVHDGEKFVHEPLRLSVFIEAPREQIEYFIHKHEVVRQLVDNQWLHLIHIDSASLKCERRVKEGTYVTV